jgi:carbon-monoxide dehydrogenase medium subunit
MKAGKFEFIRARSVEEASRLLREADGSGRVIAGAQSLGPMLNLRLARPELLIDITGIPEMTIIEETPDSVTLGACVTSANIEDGKLPGQTFEALSVIASRIAYRAVRNRGTVGGSLCHADPAADWPTVLCAIEADCLIAGPNGRRWLKVSDFVTGAYETALAPAEVLERIKLPRPSSAGRLGYCKIARKVGEFATAIAAVMNDPERATFRAVIGATNGLPIVIPDARTLLNHDNTIDKSAAKALLAQHGITGRLALLQQTAALGRAYDRAFGR